VVKKVYAKNTKAKKIVIVKSIWVKPPDELNKLNAMPVFLVR
jgi:hypothetical protein